jgi:hypothetical protein
MIPAPIRSTSLFTGRRFGRLRDRPAGVKSSRSRPVRRGSFAALPSPEAWALGAAGQAATTRARINASTSSSATPTSST